MIRDEFGCNFFVKRLKPIILSHILIESISDHVSAHILQRPLLLKIKHSGFRASHYLDFSRRTEDGILRKYEKRNLNDLKSHAVDYCTNNYHCTCLFGRRNARLMRQTATQAAGSARPALSCNMMHVNVQLIPSVDHERTAHEVFAY